MNPYAAHDITVAKRACEQGEERPSWCDPPEPTRWPGQLFDHLPGTAASSWTVLAPTALLVLLAGGLLLARMCRVERDVARRARWVELIPAAHTPHDGGRRLWQGLAGVLTASGGFGSGHRRRRIAVEFVAGTTGVRAGVWVPPNVSIADVCAAIAHGWPGAQTRVTTPPVYRGSEDGPSPRIRTLRPSGRDPWTPLLNPARHHRRDHGPARDGEPDRLHGVLSALADRRAGHRGACVQLVVTAAPTPGHACMADGPVWARILWWAACLPLRALVEVLTLFFTSPKTSHHGYPQQRAPSAPQGTENPLAAAHRRAVIAKQARGPHLRVTLRIAALPPDGARRRDPTASIALGYTIVPDQTVLTIRRPVRGPRLLVRRAAGPGRDRFVVTVDEAAALWHLPDEPTRYGLAAAPAHDTEPAHTVSRRPRTNRGGRDAAA